MNIHKIITTTILLNTITWGGVPWGYLTPVIKSTCSPVKNLYYRTIQDAKNNYFGDISSSYTYPTYNIMRPIVDQRYVNPISTYIRNFNAPWTPNHGEFTGLDARQGYLNTVTGTYKSRFYSGNSVVQTECIDGALAFGTNINLNDAPKQFLLYSGPQSTLVYNFAEPVRPWKYNRTGNYMLQARFQKPYYQKFDRHNEGGNISFILYMHNRKTELNFSYVLPVYGFGEGSTSEKSKIKYDPSTSTAHVQGGIHRGTKYSTMSAYSHKSTGPRKNGIITPHAKGSDWKDFYRVSITYQNLANALKSAASTKDKKGDKDKKGTEAYNAQLFASNPANLDPANWDVTNSGIQYEIAEGHHDDPGYWYSAVITGSHWNFNTYISQSANGL